MPRPSQFEVAAAHEEVRASYLEGWPVPGSPYDWLIQAELIASRITHIGCIPGVILDMGYVYARQAKMNMPPDMANERNHLHVARKTIAADRVASGALSTTVFMSITDAAVTFEQMGASNRLWRQFTDLSNASKDGWNIRLVSNEEIAEVLPKDASNLIIIGDPEKPDAVYEEFVDGAPAPHETWRTDAEARETATAAYAHISSIALDGSTSQTRLEKMTEYYLHLPVKVDTT